MFSFGIFTTHIPYIALMAFYAYFLLFGVEKASKGEIQNDGSYFISELTVENTIALNNAHDYSFEEKASFFKNVGFEPFIVVRKSGPPVSLIPGILQPGHCSGFSNRPPPSIG